MHSCTDPWEFAVGEELAMPDRILDATERLLARFGYRKMTMDDVAREAGIGKRTIYLHFPSKEEVALASIDRVVARLEERLWELARGTVPVHQRLRQMLLCRVLFRFDSVRDYSHSLNDLFESLRPAYMARRHRYFAREAAVFAAILEEGIAAGEFAAGDPLAHAHTLLLATNALIPYSLSVHELGRRETVQETGRPDCRSAAGWPSRSPHRKPASRPLATRPGPGFGQAEQGREPLFKSVVTFGAVKRTLRGIERGEHLMIRKFAHDICQLASHGWHVRRVGPAPAFEPA